MHGGRHDTKVLRHDFVVECWNQPSVSRGGKRLAAEMSCPCTVSANRGRKPPALKVLAVALIPIVDETLGVALLVVLREHWTFVMPIILVVRSFDGNFLGKVPAIYAQRRRCCVRAAASTLTVLFDVPLGGHGDDGTAKNVKG